MNDIILTEAKPLGNTPPPGNTDLCIFMVQSTAGPLSEQLGQPADRGYAGCPAMSRDIPEYYLILSISPATGSNPFRAGAKTLSLKEGMPDMWACPLRELGSSAFTRQAAKQN